MKARFPLALRLGLMSLVQLALLALVAAIALRWQERPLDMMARLERITEAIEAAPPGSDLEALLRDLSEPDLRRLTLLDAEGRRLASTVEPPLTRRGPAGRPPPHGRLVPPPPPDHDHDHDHDHDPGLDEGPNPPVVRALSRGRLLIVQGEPSARWRVPVLILVASLLVLGLGAWWMARSIVEPLQRIAHATTKIGMGSTRPRLGLERTDELGDVARAFDEMADRVGREAERERELLANISHELRTPLSRVHVAMDLAVEGNTSALEGVQADLAELERLLDDALLAFRLTHRPSDASADARGRVAFPMRPFAPIAAGELLRDTQQRFRLHYPTRTLRAELEVAPSAELIGDESVLRRALENLLANAHKYTPEPMEPVTLRARVEGAELVIEVEDVGVGIPPADRPRLFEPFFRGDRSRERGTGGVGLGLALARRIVLAHGGTLEVLHPARGTTFVLRLPLHTGRLETS